MYTFIKLNIGTRKTYKSLTGTDNHYDIWIDVLQYASTANTPNCQKYLHTLRNYIESKAFTINSFAKYLDISQKTTERAFRLWIDKKIMEKIAINGEHYYRVVNYDVWIDGRNINNDTPIVENNNDVNIDKIRTFMLSENIGRETVDKWLSMDSESVGYISDIVSHTILKTEKIDNVGAYIRKTIEQNIDNLANWKNNKHSKSDKNVGLAQYEAKFSSDEPLF